jgi:hypothetical protein
MEWAHAGRAKQLGRLGEDKMEPALPALNEAASHHLPPFITAPGQSDWLLTLMLVILIGSVLGVGVFFFWLHSLPERMVHHKVQFDLVAVLALLSLFTHIHAFWVAALIIALIDFPDFSLPDFGSSMRRIAGSLEKIADDPAKLPEVTPGSTSGSQAAPLRPLPSSPTRADAPANEPALKEGGRHA